MSYQTASQYRNLVYDSFADNGYFHHKSPYRYQGFIDAMAWVGLLCGASRKIGDIPLSLKCEDCLSKLLNVGDDARNFAPCQLDGWKKSDVMDGYYYYEKPQAFAGPAGLYFAISNGAKLDLLKPIPYNPIPTATIMHMFGFLFGFILKHFSIKTLESHINSMFLSSLILNKKPSKSMKWIAAHNPFYAYIYGDMLNEEYPNLCRYKNGYNIRREEPVPLKLRKPSSWIFRSHPCDEYVDADGSGFVDDFYVPIWEVVASYLQHSLTKDK